METRQIEMSEFLFNKKYYFNCVDIDNINGIYDYLYSVLKKEVAISFDIFKKNLLDKDQVEIIDSCSHSLIFSSHMKLNLKPSKETKATPDTQSKAATKL
jgi:lichenan operon transcriptional antiterminator